jgi:PPOX class probable F420-dependent enzyme
MAATIPEQFKDLFEKKAFANLATLMPDGHPQVTPVWCDLEGSLIRINSAKGRVKDKNMRRNRKVALSILDPDNPYRHLAVQGEVVEITEQGADAHRPDPLCSLKRAAQLPVHAPAPFLVQQSHALQNRTACTGAA